MQRFTLPRDLYHGKGALEALKTLEGKKAIVCVGGGSIDLQRYLEDRGATILKDALTSNVQGAMLQSIARGGK